MSKRKDRVPGTAPGDDAPMGSDQPGNAPAALAVRGRTDVVEPIVVPNTLWTSSDPTAYQGGLDSEVNHLALFENATYLDETVAAWKGTGTAGSSPLPPYTTLFGVEGERPQDEPDVASTWVAHWRHRITVGR